MAPRPMTGKLGPEALAEVLAATGADDAAVDVGAAYGEDAAAIDLAGTESTLVVAADPLSLAADAVGELAVHVACNDVAASAASDSGSAATTRVDSVPARSIAAASSP